MGSAYDTLFRWARKTTTSFADLCFAVSVHEESHTAGEGLIYRLKHWPELPPPQRTADIYRALSLMSNRPVNRAWFLKHSRMKAKQLDRLLDGLVAQGAVEVFDAASLPRR